MQALNWLICDARGRRKLKVNPRCKDLIRDLKFMVFKEGTDQPDKSDPERSHHSDALGYCVLGAMKPLMPKEISGSELELHLLVTVPAGGDKRSITSVSQCLLPTFAFRDQDLHLLVSLVHDRRAFSSSPASPVEQLLSAFRSLTEMDLSEEIEPVGDKSLHE